MVALQYNKEVDQSYPKPAIHAPSNLMQQSSIPTFHEFIQKKISKRPLGPAGHYKPHQLPQLI
jgi:hypothetical protein